MSPPMKGLVQFISDLRNAKEKEEEDKRVHSELVHIQKQFEQQGGSLSGYNRKKYICKLLYIYLMGYDINFGFNESVNLLQSSVYSERSIGYLSINLFLTLNPSLGKDIIDHLKSDLLSANEDFNCLALNFLANTEIDESYLEVFDDLVFNFVRAPTTSNLLKKKAALAMLNLIKANSMIIERNPSWIPRIIALVDSQDYGLSLAITSLIIHIAQLDYESCKPCISIVISKLYNIVIENNCPKDHYYYNVPAPWLTAKLFHLLEVMIPDNRSVDLDAANLALIQQVLQKSISSAISKRGSSSIEAQNTNGFILFSSISLASHIDPSEEQSIRVADALIALLDVADTNTRYLALGSLVKIAAREENSTLGLINDQIAKVFNLLKDRDVSIRHKALDLIYITCNSQNVEDRCSKLLGFLAIAEYALKPDIAVKIASLAENKATDANWFIVTIMKLIADAGVHIGDEVWYRLIQIIVNNDNIQATSCVTAVKYLRTSNYPESMLKVASFVLGEFGDKIVDTVSPTEQFDLLMEKYFQSSVSCRSMILSALIRLFARHQEVRLQIKNLFQQEVNSFSVEIQQRVLEYLQLITRDDNMSLLKIAVEELPPFVTKTSPLIARLGNVEVVKQSFKLLTPQNTNTNNMITPTTTGSSVLSNSGKRQAPVPPPSRGSLVYQNTNGSARLSNSSLSLHITSPTGGLISPSVAQSIKEEENPFDSAMDGGSTTELSSSMSLLNINASLSSGWENGYYRLIHFDQGIFYENSLFKIIYRLKREKSTLHFHLSYVNKLPSALTSLTADIKDPKLATAGLEYAPHYIINVVGRPESTVAANGKTFHMFDIMIREPFKDSDVPVLTISYFSGGMNTIRLKLPCVLLKCMQAAPLPNPNVFFQRWTQIGTTLGASGETQKVVSLSKRLSNIAVLRRCMELIGFFIIEEADPNPNNLVCAGILNTKTGGFGCLLRVEVSPEMNAIRITLRSTQAGISDILVSTLGDFYVRGL